MIKQVRIYILLAAALTTYQTFAADIERKKEIDLKTQSSTLYNEFMSLPKKHTYTTLSPNNVTLAASYGKKIHLYNITAEKNTKPTAVLYDDEYDDDEVGKDHAAPETLDLVFSPDSQTLAARFRSGIGRSGAARIVVWDLATEDVAELEYVKNGSDLSVNFSNDGSALVAGCWDKSITVWDTSTKQSIARMFGHTSYVNTAKFSPGDRDIVSGSNDDTCKLWDIETHQEKTTLTGHTGQVNALAHTSDGAVLVSGSYDTTVKLWDPRQGKEITTLSGDGEEVLSVAMSPDNATIVSRDSAGRINTWCMRTHALLDTLIDANKKARSVLFNAAGTLLISSSTLWSKKTDTPVTAKSQQLSQDDLERAKDVELLMSDETFDFDIAQRDLSASLTTMTKNEALRFRIVGLLQIKDRSAAGDAMLEQLKSENPEIYAQVVAHYESMVSGKTL